MKIINTYLQFYSLANRHVRKREVELDNEKKIYYICNYKIPKNFQFSQLRNMLFDTKESAIENCWEIYKKLVLIGYYTEDDENE